MKGTNNIKYEQWCALLSRWKKKRHRRRRLMFILHFNWKVLKNLVRVLSRWFEWQPNEVVFERKRHALKCWTWTDANQRAQEEYEFRGKQHQTIFNQIKIELAIANDVMWCDENHHQLHYLPLKRLNCLSQVYIIRWQDMRKKNEWWM